MSSRFACPNPSCTYAFDPSQFPPGPLLLSCPACGIQFPYQPSPQPVAPPPAPAAWPSPETAPWSAPPEPPASPYGYASPAGYAQPATQPEPEGPMIRRNDDTPKGGGLLVWGVLLVLASAGIVTIAMMTRGKNTPRMTGGGDDIDRSELFNFAFKRPGPPWQADSSFREKMKINVLAIRRDEPLGYFGIAAQDYKDREPRAKELKDGINERLRFFDTTPESEPISGATWAGQPAQAFRFEGEQDGESVTGEIYAMKYRSVAYWSVAWAPRELFADQAATFAEFRERLKFAEKAETFVAKKAAAKEFTAGGASVTDTDGFWADHLAKQEKFVASEFDPKAVIYLVGEVDDKRKDLKRTPINRGHLMVLVLDGEGDALAKAKEYIVAKVKEGDDPTAKFGDVTEPLPEGASEPTIAMLRLQSTSDTDKSKNDLHIITAVNANGKTLVAWARCDKQIRDFWHPYFIKIAGSLKSAGAELKSSD